MDEDQSKTNTQREAERIAAELLEKSKEEGISQDTKESLERQAGLTLKIAEAFSNFIKSQKN